MKTHKLLFLLVSLLLFNCDHEDLSQNEITTVTTPFNVPNKHQPLIHETTNKNANDSWVQVWGDEFDGTTIDTTKWNVTVSSKSRTPRPKQGVSDWWWVKANAYLNGKGQLVLRGTKKDKNTMHCGSVDSRGKYEPKFGFIEVRLKIANTQKGNHTAFWLQGANQGLIDDSGRDGAEIDVFESAWVGNFTKAVVHIDGYGASHKANTKRYDAANLHDGYHTFGLDWTAEKMDIYYDGKKTVSYSGKWVPNVQEWLWLSVGASFGDGDFKNQPIGHLSNATVDYIRVYKKSHFRLVNKKTKKWLRILGNADNTIISQSPLNAKGDWTQWSIRNTSKGYFYFINKSSEKYFRPESNTDGALLLQKDTSFGGSWSQWKTLDAGDGYVYILNKETGKILRPKDATDDAPILLKDQYKNTNDWAKWKMEFIEN